MPKPYTDPQRTLAEKRAKKFVKLFKGTTFDNILEAAETQPNSENPPQAFIDACKPAKLETSEIKWLWNYLQHCDSNYYAPVPEAAATGW